MEREQQSKGHSPTGDHRGRDKSGHRKKGTKQGALTSWRSQREGQGRTWKESNQARGTHFLETTEGGEVRTWKESDQARGTHFLETTEGGGQVKTQKESDQARGTHILEITEGGTSQDMERKQLNKGNSLSGDHRGRDKSGHGKKATKQGALTNWRQQREGQSGHGKKRVRDHKTRDEEGNTDPILVVTFFQQQVTIQMMVLQLTQIDGKAIMHVFITASVLPFPCSKS